MDGDNVATDIQEYVRARLWFPAEVADATYPLLIAYVLLAAVVRISDLFEAIPYLYFHGAPGSGKSEAGNLLAGLTRGASSVNISKAALFRWLDQNKGQFLFIDEASRLSSADYRDVMNAGYRRGGKVYRCDGPSHTPVSFEVFGPKAFAANRGIPIGAIESRCVLVEFTEAPMTFVPEPGNADQEGRLLQQAEQWASNHLEDLRAAEARWRHDTSTFSSQRMRQIWAPLFAIGEVAGLLEPLQQYAEAHQHLRDIRHTLAVRDRLDPVLAELADYAKAQGYPGAVPFKVIREFVEARLDGISPSGKAIAQALGARGWTASHTRDGTFYLPPRKGPLSRLFGGR